MIHFNMTDVRKTNEKLGGGETEIRSVESRSSDKQTKLETAVAGAEEQFEMTINDVANLEQEVGNDAELSETDRQELLIKIKSIKSGIQARWRIFLKKIKAGSHDFFRRAGEPWSEDLELENRQGEPTNPENIKKSLSAISLRLQYIGENKLYSVYDTNFSKKLKKKNQEAKTAWLSAWHHLVYASKGSDHLLESDENRETKEIVEENTEAAYTFWKTVLDQRLPGKKPSDLEFLITGKSENGEIPVDFFVAMPKVLRKGFHKAYLEWLGKGFENPRTNMIRDVNSVDVVSRDQKGDLMSAYSDYLNQSFNFGDLLSVLAKVKPAHTEEELLGLDQDRRVYSSLEGVGLEDRVANMAIHRAAFQTAGVSIDSWRGDDKEFLTKVRRQTEAAMPTFLENLYKSLKDHPTALIQAFKGLLKIPTYYYAPAGALKEWAGYKVYSEEQGTFVSSFRNIWGGLNTFEERSRQIEGFVFGISAPADYNTILNFILEKGRTKKSLETVGFMFVEAIVRAEEEETSVTAKSIDKALVSESVQSLRRFASIFPGGQPDGGSFFNAYSERLQRDGVDILARIDRQSLSEIEREVYGARRIIFDFANTHQNQDDAAEVIAEHIQRLHAFIGAVGFFHENAFRAATRDSATAARSLAVLNEIPAGLSKIIKIRILDTYETWLGIPKEKRAVYIQVMILLDQTPSQEIKRILNELRASIMESDDPLSSWQKIEAIFIKNNLPLVGKIFKIFQTLHSAEKMTEKLANSPTLSPYLRRASLKRRKYTIFCDLLKVHIESGNRSLRQYLEVLREGEIFFEMFEGQKNKVVSSDDQKRLQMYIVKLKTIFFESQMGVASSQITTTEMATVDQMKEVYRSLCQSLGVKSGQSVSDRVVEMFASRLGYKSIDEVLSAMYRKKQMAHERGLRYVHGAVGWRLRFSDGDILKGVDQQYIASILQNGSVAKEYLGAGSSQDNTPYDTDVAVIGKKADQSFSQTISDSVAKDYGNILLVIRDRGQFVRTSAETVGQIDPSKLELFRTGVAGEQHYGIRTGFPTTEIDFIICKTAEKIPEPLSIEIVQNGYYIPVVDETGKIIFTPEQYESLRSFYSGLDRFDGPPFVYEQTKEGSRQFADVRKAKAHLQETREQVDEVTKNIQNLISEVLREQGIDLKEIFDTSLLGAELFDTGSTGRHTNLPGAFDFDLVLKLDLADEKKADRIVSALREKWSPAKDNSHGSNAPGDLFQLRFEGARIGEVVLDIDIAFVRKSELSVYGSHDAIKEKLTWIQKHLGNEAQDDIVANIIVAKEVLKRADAYKKLEHGGIGGIGVENWLLAHGGNFEQAARAFWKAAHDESGKLRSLANFQDHYQIIDPGVNVKFQSHDNFIHILKEQGYQNMLVAIGKYFNWQ